MQYECIVEKQPYKAGYQYNYHLNVEHDLSEWLFVPRSYCINSTQKTYYTVYKSYGN